MGSYRLTRRAAHGKYAVFYRIETDGIVVARSLREPSLLYDADSSANGSINRSMTKRSIVGRASSGRSRSTSGTDQ